VQKNSKISERDGVCPTRVECSESELAQLKSLTSDARTSDTLSVAGFVVGGALVVGGVAAIIFAPKPKARAESAWLLPALAPHAVGFAGGMTW
jgi:hypothetical protein